MDSPQIDSTLVKMILTSIKEGDLTAITNLRNIILTLNYLKIVKRNKMLFSSLRLLKSMLSKIIYNKYSALNVFK